MEDLSLDEIELVSGGLTTAEKIGIFAAGVGIGASLGLGGVALAAAVIIGFEANE